MEDEEALELYNFFVKEGYDLGDENNFKSALQDDSKRVELHTFFDAEGYDVGDVNNFILKKKKVRYPYRKIFLRTCHQLMRRHLLLWRNISEQERNCRQ